MIVPKAQRSNVLKSCHNPPTMAHFGFRKTLYRMQESYYWPHMRGNVLKFVRNCLTCGAQKSTNLARIGFMGKEKAVDKPFQTIALDLSLAVKKVISGFWSQLIGFQNLH